MKGCKKWLSVLTVVTMVVGSTVLLTGVCSANALVPAIEASDATRVDEGDQDDSAEESWAG